MTQRKLVRVMGEHAGVVELEVEVRVGRRKSKLTHKTRKQWSLKTLGSHLYLSMPSSVHSSKHVSFSFVVISSFGLRLLVLLLLLPELDTAALDRNIGDRVPDISTLY